MTIAELAPGNRGYEQFAHVLETVYHWNVAPIEAEMRRSRITVPALFSDGTVISFLVLQDYRFPHDSIGNELRAESLSGILAMDNLKVFHVRLVHGDAKKAYHLKEPVSRLFGYVEEKLGKEGHEHCFLVSVYQDRDPKSRRLYESLGFKEKGAPSYCLEMDPSQGREASLRPASVPPGIRIDFLTEFSVIPAESWAAAYNRVFCGGSDIVTGKDLLEMLAGPEFSKRLSMLVYDEEGDRVGGFLLADRPRSGTARIIVVGLLPELRSKGIVQHGWPCFLRRCREEKVKKVLFITGKRGMRAMATRHLGATEKNRLVWMLKCSRT